MEVAHTPVCLTAFRGASDAVGLAESVGHLGCSRGVAFIITFLLVNWIGSGAECLESTDHGNGLVIRTQYGDVSSG
jgi:hypothetical protein